MKILITGICGFVGSSLAVALAEGLDGAEIVGIDNLLRPGAEGNRAALAARGLRFFHGDLRMRSDIEALPKCHWVIDAAANPSVLAGVDGRSSPRQLCEHNLGGTLNILEYCREHKAGLVLLSSSRVYSAKDLAGLPVREEGKTFVLDTNQPLPPGATVGGITEQFPTRQPVSLYGATKLASEIMVVEYSQTFGFPVWINRCGVLAGAGQFGTAEQGIFSYWLHAHAARQPLRYIGFGGRGYQVRDAFHPQDLAGLIRLQLRRDPPEDAVFNAGGGQLNAMSLAELTRWCDQRFGAHEPQPSTQPRPFDAPWVVMDSTRIHRECGWAPQRNLASILDEIAVHVREHPGWLALCGAVLKSREPAENHQPLRLLSVVIPARNEEGCIASTVEHLHVELRLQDVPHEIIVVDDGSTDATWRKLAETAERVSALRPLRNEGLHGFGRAIIYGLDRMAGDAVVIMMADESDDCRDVVQYWRLLNEGWDAVFGSRFVKGGGVIDYPWLKLRINRFANWFIHVMFRIPLNDTTNAFKAYRRTVIDGCRPLLSPHFNLTVELPLKTIVRDYTWTVIPITWRNRRIGEAKLNIKEMGSRYLFICLYVWLEKYFSAGDYRRSG